MREQVLLLWEGLNNGQRTILVGGAGVLMALVVVFVMASGRQSNATLFSGLEQSDAAAIVSNLGEQGIAFEIADGGSTIRVAPDIVLEQRLRLAQEGIPAGGTVGFEIFDEVSFTITDLTQRVNFQRALEGELVRTIASMDAVQSARVHLVLPEQSLFAEQQAVTTSAVVLSIRPGKRLSIEQVAGIRTLVSASVENLDPAGVSIVDGSGNVLTLDLDAGDVFGVAVGAGQLEVQREFENERSREIQRFVQNVVGPNKAAVSVRAEFNFDATETFTETFTPTTAEDEGIARSQQTVNESFTGPASEAPGGVPGVTTNLPGGESADAEETATGASEYERSETVTNFDISRSEQRLVSAPGTINRLSISVFIDESIDTAAVDSIRTALATQIDETRGDSLSVEQIAFDTTAADEAQRQLEAAESQAQLTQYITIAVVVLVAVGMLFFLFRLTRAIRGAVVPPKVEIPELAGMAGSLAISDDMPAASRALLVEEMRARSDDGELPPGFDELDELPDLEQQELEAMMRERDRMRQRLMTIARERPDEVVRLLETWLAQD
jgi:flagellar M-ring protein FliF